MTYTTKEVRAIYDRTSGHCHLCHKKLARTNYGKVNARGGWEVDHSVARAAGGTDHGNNLRAACTPCNRSKQDGSTRTARARHGQTRAPNSRAKRAEKKVANTWIGAGLGGAAGLIFGPVGALGGAIIGALVGNSVDVPK
jgi:5-methylcytosine-specific restriction endonuclease McrA